MPLELEEIVNYKDLLKEADMSAFLVFHDHICMWLICYWNKEDEQLFYYDSPQSIRFPNKKNLLKIYRLPCLSGI